MGLGGRVEKEEEEEEKEDGRTAGGDFKVAPDVLVSSASFFFACLSASVKSRSNIHIVSSGFIQFAIGLF